MTNAPTPDIGVGCNGRGVRAVELLLEISQSWDGRFEGTIRSAGNAAQTPFSGTLQLLTALESLIGQTPMANLGVEVHGAPRGERGPGAQGSPDRRPPT
jgi:hypothetical protein